MARNYKWLEVGNTRARVDTSARAEFLPAVTWRFSVRSTGMKISSRVVEAGMKVHNGLKFQPGLNFLSCNRKRCFLSNT